MAEQTILKSKNEWETIWENPNLSATFAAGSITVPDVSRFKEIKVKLKEGFLEQQFEIDSTIDVYSLVTAGAGSGFMFIRRRMFNITSATQISFQDCWAVNATLTPAKENDYCIPAKIYAR